MKLQGIAVVFILILLPLTLVLSTYTQLQIKTLALQKSYDSKLIDATYDAVAALQLNTANEDLSNVADSFRSIVEASNNVFINTMSTNLGISNASKSYLSPYVPAILTTLYDGYYIYSPTKVPEVVTYDSNLVPDGGYGYGFEINSDNANSSFDKDVLFPEDNYKLEKDAIEQKNATISVTKRGQYFINGKQIAAEDLVSELNALKPTLEKPEVVVKADTEAKSSEILKIMKAAQDAEYEKLVVAGEPLTKKEQRALENISKQNQNLEEQTKIQKQNASASPSYNWDE